MGKVLTIVADENEFDVITWAEEKEKIQNGHTWKG